MTSEEEAGDGEKVRQEGPMWLVAEEADSGERAAGAGKE